MKNNQKETNLLSRRKFLKGLATGTLMLAGGAYIAKGSLYRQAVNGMQSLTGDLQSRFLRQMITTNAATSRVLMWQSDSRLSQPQVEYRLKGQSNALKASAQEDFFTDDGIENLQYLAQLENLTPETNYEYRLVSEKSASDWHSLKTAGASTFKCLIFPDSQSSDYSDWENLAQTAATLNPDAAFFINMGDIVDNGEDHTQWQAWFNDVEGIIDRIPFAPLMGNHETYDQNWKVRLPEAYLHYFALPDNDSKDFSRYYYDFDYGDVHFMALNSQWDETEDFKPGLMEKQKTWLRESCSRSTKRWKIALIHKDVLQYRITKRPERKEGISSLGMNFMPLFDELGVDVVFTAHLHTYRNRGHIRNFQRDNGGPLYILTGVAGNVRYPGLWIDHALDEKVAPQPETDNYLTLEANENRLTIKCFLPDGQEIDQAVVEKQA